jgi:pSer/pThr/pTyr-binding forkhead associated (FHA) protein
LLAGAVVAAFLTARPKPELAVETARAGRRRAVRRRAGMARPGTAPPAEAYLVPEGSEEERIPLTGSDVLLGRDPSLAAVRLEDASVSPIHARLIRQADGGYVLRDQGSIAGTWLNAEQVPAEGVRLQHGDCIHLGRVAFRFRLAVEPPPPEVRLTASASPGTHHNPPERPT